MGDEEKDAVIILLAEALRLTREYCGKYLLPAEEGWSWYDALNDERVKEVLNKYGYTISIPEMVAHG
jgi:hypothetical protein